MTPFDLFLRTLAIGAGVGACFFFVLASFVVAYRLADLLDSTIAALKRYAVRDMVITAYYDPEHMRHVSVWQKPTPYMMTVARQFKRDAKKGGRDAG
jgi:hypothetical protein